jgi:hypothetical protein
MIRNVIESSGNNFLMHVGETKDSAEPLSLLPLVVALIKIRGEQESSCPPHRLHQATP